jgi:hypothetical protein
MGANETTMSVIDGSGERNSLATQAREAIEDEARAAAESVRTKRRTELLLAMLAVAAKSAEPANDLDLAAAAKVVGATQTTFKRAKVEADYFVGTRPRWRNAESVREKFAARGKAPTTPEPRAAPPSTDDVDVSALLDRGGLRVVGGKRR